MSWSSFVCIEPLEAASLHLPHGTWIILSGMLGGSLGGIAHYTRCLAPIHGLTFATPPLVGLAAKKVYSHRIRIATPKSERSMQYGSDFATVAELLEEYSAERVIDEVLSEIEIPM